MAIVPTFIYVAICKLGMPEGNIDMGSTIGSYFGLVFLIAAYSAIGILLLPYQTIKSWRLSFPYSCAFFSILVLTVWHQSQRYSNMITS
jgi:hypothetical protein